MLFDSICLYNTTCPGDRRNSHSRSNLCSICQGWQLQAMSCNLIRSLQHSDQVNSDLHGVQPERTSEFSAVLARFSRMNILTLQILFRETIFKCLAMNETCTANWQRYRSSGPDVRFPGQLWSLQIYLPGKDGRQSVIRKSMQILADPSGITSLNPSQLF